MTLNLPSNIDTYITLFTLVAGWLGVSTWRKKRAATAAEIDRWASTAAGAVAIAIQAGVLGTHEAAVAKFLERFRQLATAVGVTLSPDQESRALAIAHDVLVGAGETKLITEFDKLHPIVEHFAEVAAGWRAKLAGSR